MNRYQSLKQWVKSSPHPAATGSRWLWYGMRHFELPAVKLVFRPLGWLHQAVSTSISWLLRTCYWTPIFKAKLSSPAPRLYIYSGMPQLLGPLELTLGSNCCISGMTTFSGRWAGKETPRLEMGDSVSISWQVSIASGRLVKLGNRVRIAGQCMLAGYPGHPLDAQARAKGLPETEDQVGDIILEDDVWLCTGVKVMAGVHIGAGTVVAAGSIVTRDLPAGVIAAGIPARPVRKIVSDTDTQQVPATEPEVAA